MNTRIPAPAEPSRARAADQGAVRQDDLRPTLDDYRPEALAQLRLQHLADASPRVRQLESLGRAMNPGADQRPAGNPVNHIGLPDRLKAGIESLSGVSMDPVRVHYNSSEPARLGAHAYAQGSDIHLAPGQEQHLPHEAWHVVQQGQGRVQPTRQLKQGIPVNDDAGLEHEADVMGAKALSAASSASLEGLPHLVDHGALAVQRKVGYPQMVEAFKGLAPGEVVALIDTCLGQLREQIGRFCQDQAGLVTAGRDDALVGQVRRLVDVIMGTLAKALNGYEEIAGYVRELTMAAAQVRSGAAVSPSGKDTGQADAIWAPEGDRQYAAQTKTVKTWENIFADENLPKAIEQLAGIHGESPPEGAVRVADLAVLQPVPESSVDYSAIRARLLEVLQTGWKSGGTYAAHVDQIRLWVDLALPSGELHSACWTFDNQARPVSSVITSRRSPMPQQVSQVRQGAPHRFILAYPAAYPENFRAGKATLGELANDYSVLNNYRRDLQGKKDKEDEAQRALEAYAKEKASGAKDAEEDPDGEGMGLGMFD
jgi:hypothetical protein